MNKEAIGAEKSRGSARVLILPIAKALQDPLLTARTARISAGIWEPTGNYKP